MGKGLYYLGMAALSAIGAGLLAWLGAPETGVALGEALGNAGIAAVVLPVLMFGLGALIKLIPKKPEPPVV